ncbi:ABC transporter ATP-binding protein [uncultured Streptomyces sp.]|uniref:ABC transporter ATP-binding protein n=1 Tax=uncultured Streptomyces sp. TaxID=174707 RepID=UPI00262C516D|nr:ABC transporter ATP-binding protein [uncultured Streptomyces sp.]
MKNMSSPSGLEVRGLHVGYPGRAVVRDVGFSAPAGTVTSVVGPNGCGKSTLLRALARLHRPSRGTVLADGADVWKSGQRQAAHRIALLPQSPRAPEAVTVAGLVRYGRHPHQGLLRQWSRADERAVREALEATSTTELAGERLDRLSGGQRQRCWLAMVLAQQTPVVLLDEPTSALDLGHVVDVLELVRTVAREGRTVVMVQHDLAAAARYSDHVIAMKDGEVVGEGAPRDTVDAELVRSLYGVEADILRAPVDGSPVVVPRARTADANLADPYPADAGQVDAGRVEAAS